MNMISVGTIRSAYILMPMEKSACKKMEQPVGRLNMMILEGKQKLGLSD